MKSDPYTIWLLVRDRLVEHFKDKAVKFALKKLLGSAMAGGFKGWLVKFIAEYLFEEIAEPVIKLAIRKGFLVVDKISGHITVKKINKAKENNDEDSYVDSIGSV